jgi:hypothetical protein
LFRGNYIKVITNVAELSGFIKAKRFLKVKTGKNRSFFGKTASLYRKTTTSGKINCKFAADIMA